jgi:hypothetical protein
MLALLFAVHGEKFITHGTLDLSQSIHMSQCRIDGNLGALATQSKTYICALGRCLSSREKYRAMGFHIDEIDFEGCCHSAIQSTQAHGYHFNLFRPMFLDIVFQNCPTQGHTAHLKMPHKGLDSKMHKMIGNSMHVACVGTVAVLACLDFALSNANPVQATGVALCYRSMFL